MTQCIQTAEGTGRVLLKVLGKQKAFRKCQGGAGPLRTLGHLRHQESSTGLFQGSPSHSPPEAGVVGVVGLACRASGARSCAESV